LKNLSYILIYVQQIRKDQQNNEVDDRPCLTVEIICSESFDIFSRPWAWFFLNTFVYLLISSFDSSYFFN
jgi:hypothetical protein